MKNKTIMKIISICFMFIVIFNVSSPIFAAVNDKYGENVEVIEPDLEGKLQNSVLLEAIASLVYGLGSLVESLVGDAFQILTGQNMFPWADRVIFNTIPFLDVNFLNPSTGSLFLDSGNKETILAGIVRNMYFTILTLSIGFLGIVVGVMAIRLAISSIAAEKAKYKQAIAKFLVSLIMLFCVHYAIALIFYVNESLVEIASEMLKDATANADISGDEFLASSVSDEEMVEQFFKDQNATDRQDEILGDKEKVAAAAFLLKNTTYKKYAIPDAKGNGQTERTVWQKIAKVFSKNDSVETLISDVNIATSSPNTYKNKIDAYNNTTPEKYIKNEGKKEYEAYMKESKEDWQKIAQKNSVGGTDFLEDSWEGKGIYEGQAAKDKYTKEYLNEALPNIMKVYQVVVNASNDATRKQDLSTESLITEMGAYFKENAWTYETDEDGNIAGWDNNSLTLQGAILYAVFVVQSVLYFVAYVKRFFFVVILAMIAPIIVIYDFLGKAIS